MLILNQYEYLDTSQIERISEQTTGFFVWKDKNHCYLGGNNQSGECVQLSSTQELIGLTDYDLNWLSGGHTAEYFQKIDKQVMAGKYITNEKEIIVQRNSKGEIVVKVMVVSKRPLMRNKTCMGIVLQATDATHLFFPTLASNSSTIWQSNKEKFTTRERDCMKYLVFGYSCKRIAAELHLSSRTVEHHVENIKEKLNCTNKQQLIDTLLILGNSNVKGIESVH